MKKVFGRLLGSKNVSNGSHLERSVRTQPRQIWDAMLKDIGRTGEETLLLELPV